MMGNLDNLFKAAEGNPEDRVECNSIGFPITPESSNEEILDWIMCSICSKIDVSRAAFKGGYLLTKIMPPGVARATEDIDFSISEPDYYEVVKNAISEIGTQLVQAHVIDSFEVKENIAERMSGGIKFRRNSNQTIDLGIDVGLHPLNYGVKLDIINGFNIQRFTVERMLSDKISTIYSRKRFRRTKDLYDVYILSEYFDIDLGDLLDNINTRGVIEWERSPFKEEVSAEYEKAYNKLHVNGVTASDENSGLPKYDVIMHRLACIVSNLEHGRKWVCSDGRVISI